MILKPLVNSHIPMFSNLSRKRQVRGFGVLGQVQFEVHEISGITAPYGLGFRREKGLPESPLSLSVIDALNEESLPTPRQAGR